MIEYTLPFPVSVNGMFPGKSRRFKSPAYKRWWNAAGWEMRRQKVPRITVPVIITIDLTPPDKRRRDADNLIKCVIDLAVKMDVLPEDSSRHVRSVTARWADEPGEPGALVRITPA